MARILIVDDEKENRQALVRSLGDENPTWTITAAASEHDGLCMLRDHIGRGEPIDVIITDLVMASEQSGMNMLQEARALDPLVMAILFTAKEKSLNRYEAFEYGAFDVVEKNIRGTSASREINIKTKAALKYREWSQRINFMRRYFDPRLFDIISKNPDMLTLKARTVTIAFWDIRGFSTLCEALKANPALIAGFLREHCQRASVTIFQHGGLLDKFIGDGIMAIFGALEPAADQGNRDALNAAKAAADLEMQFRNVLRTWTERWNMYTPTKIDIGLGCGLHTGEVLVGNVGTDFRDQFTALGPEVNLTSRICSRASSGQVLLSQTTATRLRGVAPLRPIGEIADVKNISGIFALHALDIEGLLSGNHADSPAT